MAPCPHVLLGIVAATLAGAVWAGDRGLPEGDGRRPRGDLDDHAELDRDLGRHVPVRRRRPAAEQRRTSRCRSRTTSPSGAKLPVFWGDQDLQGLHIGFFIALAALVVFWIAPQPDDARLRGARGRLQPRGGARTAGSACKKNLIRAMAISGAFAGLAGGLDMLGYLYRYRRLRHPGLVRRLPRHRRRAARPQHRRRRRPRRAPLRRAALRHDARPAVERDRPAARRATSRT